MIRGIPKGKKNLSDKELEEIDFIIMTLVRNGVQKVFTIKNDYPSKFMVVKSMIV